MTSHSGEGPSCGTPLVRRVLSVFSDGKPHSAADVAKELGVNTAEAQGYIDSLASFQNDLKAVGEANGLTLYIDPINIEATFSSYNNTDA